MGTQQTSVRVGVAATGALAALVVGLGGTANAVPPPNGTVDQLAVVGSDTTYSFMSTFTKAFNANTGFNKDHDKMINIAANPTGNQTIPAQGACKTARTYGLKHLPPDGSTAGRQALYGTDGLMENANNPSTGCLDIARSSGSRDPAVDPATAQFFAYAKDAVSYTYWGSGPANLSQSDLQAIYTCSKTTWQQIPGSGKTGTILRYLPQDGSGTRDFFLKTVLGGVTVAPSSAACPLDETVQENTGTAVPKAKQAKAILPYSAGQWVVQNKSGSGDKTAGNKIGAINGVKAATGDGKTAAPNSKAILSGSFLGSRFLYNVLDTRIPSYAQALRAVGVDNTGAGLLCNGSQSSAISKAGFVPLAKGATGGGVSVASFCRRS